MLSLADLKRGLHDEQFGRAEKALMALAYIGKPASVSEISSAMGDAGFRQQVKWNISTVLGRTKGKAINVRRKWEITEDGVAHLRKLGFLRPEPAKVHLAEKLRREAQRIRDADAVAYTEEAISCYEAGYYRAAVVMSWVAAFHLLKVEVLTHHLAAFNAELIRINPKAKPAKTLDDLGLLKERDFLDRMSAISALGKNVKTELAKCLDLRNSCGHPNSLKIAGHAVAHHLEVLLLNVFQKV